MGELEEALSTGVQGPVLYDAHRFLARQGMKAEDYDWQLERERSRLESEDVDEARWRLQQLELERRKLKKEDRDEERERKHHEERKRKCYELLRMLRADTRRAPPRRPLRIVLHR